MTDFIPQAIDVPEGDVTFFSEFFCRRDADRLLVELRETTTWQHESITLYGKSVMMPRLTAWYGDEGTAYTYSGLRNVPMHWTPALVEVKRAVELHTGELFNSVLLNLYRTGQDSVAWHSDDEKEFGENPVIASVSFGATRMFQFRHKKRKELKSSIELTHGSLLMMKGETQHHWLHQIPKTMKKVGERINLTFRLVRRLDNC
ncbi:MAG: alpha-ketoglutarate-dependent dioxygenase AlkB [Planctomycetia bacterium]|nr:alpha-ketoglutarate-dependent dioxygenase AlkB [Planctomycetia bacterium]